jgi:predicted NUDIX family phosphoesterase
MVDEQVLVIPAAALDRLGPFRGFRADLGHRLAYLLDPAHVEFRPRAAVETDPSYKQLIPYIVLRCGDQLFHYTRGAAGGEARLRALRSVGVGGHISAADAAGSADPYRAGLARELAEEVEVATPHAERLLGLVYDPSTPVGEVHLGVVHLLTLERPDVRPREDGLADAGFAPLGELWAQRSAFETWSQLVLGELVQDVVSSHSAAT